MESKGEITVFELIIISTLGILVLIFFIVFIILMYQKKALRHKNEAADQEKIHQKKLLQASMEIAERERVKIASNIHDDLGMLLNVLKLRLSRAEKHSNNKEMVVELVASCFELVDSSMEIVRTIANDLMPPTLINLGFVKGMKELCRQINLSDTIEVNLSSEQEYIDLDKQTEIQVYRLVKELLNNTLKHAKPDFMEIAIESDESKLTISILHNGMGISTEDIRKLAETSTGLGLKSIFTRTQLINASLDYKILNPHRSSVVLETPLL